VLPTVELARERLADARLEVLADEPDDGVDHALLVEVVITVASAVSIPITITIAIAITITIARTVTVVVASLRPIAASLEARESVVEVTQSMEDLVQAFVHVALPG